MRSPDLRQILTRAVSALGLAALGLSASGVAGSAPAAQAQAASDVRVGVTAGPPISPRRAFLYSLLLPGAGQAKLDRHTSAAMYFLVEAVALTLVHRSAEDLRIARSFAGDSMPLRYRIDATTGLAQLDPDGEPIVDAWSAPRYDDVWVRTRRQHYEDWLAVIVFNHLFAGADAFVAAQLWDLPAKVAMRHTPRGPVLQASISFR